MLARHTKTLVLLAATLGLSGVARAELPIPADAVVAALTEVSRTPGSATAYARFLAALPALDALSPTAREAWLERARALRGAPLVSTRAELALLDHAPDGASVTQRAEALGFLTHWLVAGPDPVSDVADAQRDLLASLDTPPSVGEAVALGGQPRVWALAADGPPGGVSAEPWVLREAPTAVHLATTFTCARPISAVLRLGSTGDVAVALDGRPLGVVRALGPATPDQLEATVRLPAGEHLLVVTVGAADASRAVVYARLTDPLGRALAAVRPSDGRASGSRIAAVQHFEMIHFNEMLGDLLRNAQRDPRAALDAAVLRRALGLPDDGGGDADDGALLEDLLLSDAAAALPAGTRLLALGQVPREEARTSVLLRWETLDRDGPALDLALAQLTASRGELVRARRLVDGVAVGGAPVDPELLAVVRARVDRLDGRPETAFTTLLDPSGDPPPGASERALAEAARGALELGRPDVAAAVMGRLARALPGRIEHRAAAAQAQLDAGRVAEAVAGYTTLALRRPDLPGYALEAARLAAAAGGVAGRARALVDGVAARARWSPDLLDACGHQYEALGERDAAASAFERSLALRPASPEVRTALERLRAVAPAPMPLTVTLTAELAAAAPIDRGAAFEVLSDEAAVEVRADGSATRHVRRFVRVQRVPDDPEARTVAIAYDPSRELVSVLEARVHRGGLAIPNLARRSRALGESWYGLYYDQRELDVPFDDLREGDVIEVAWRIDAVGQLFPGVFSDIEILQGRYPIHRLAVSVVAPAELALSTHLEVPPTVDRSRFEAVRERLPDGRERFAVTARDVPPLVREPFMPGVAEVAPTWQVTTFASWDAVVAWYARLLAAQQVVTPAMRAFVDDAVRRATGPTGLSTALLERGVADYVTRDIRYVGLEFGVHGYTPYRTDQVWARRFGDCKDQATLLSTLLEAAGAGARVALVRTRSHGRLPRPLPSVGLFDHAIVWLPDSGRFVDPTASSFGLGELPPEDQGAQVLVIDPAGGPPTVGRVPVDPPGRNGLEGSYSISLRADGGGSILGTVTFRGVLAPTYRDLLLDPDARDQQLERVLNGRYPGLRLRRADVSDPTDRGRPLDVSFEAEVPQLAHRVGGTLQVGRPAGGDGQAERLAGAATRRQPLVLGAPSHTDVTFRYELPRAWAPRALPPDAEGSSRFGRWSVRWTKEVAAAQVRTSLELATDEIDPVDYPEFRAFIHAFDAAVRPPLVLHRLTPVHDQLPVSSAEGEQ